MALPDLLVDTYIKYKRGTKRVVQWLAETARATETVEHLFTNSQPQAKKTGGRLKGHARAQQKLAQAEGRNQVHIPVGALKTLAIAIASSEKVSVPLTVAITLRDVIRARKECASHYQTQEVDNEDKRAHDAGHIQFVNVLEDVYETLKPFVSVPSEMKPQKANVKKKEAARLENIFDHLELEDLADDVGSEPVPTHRPTRAEEPMIYKLETSVEETSFAIYCFLKDCTDVRLMVHRTWREYKMRHIPLTTAATTMNAAIDVFHRLNETFSADFPELDDHDKIVEYLSNGYCDPDPDAGSQANAGMDGYSWYNVSGLTLSPKTFACGAILKPYFHGFLLAGVNMPTIKTDSNPDKRTFWGERINMLKCLSGLAILSHPPSSDAPNREDFRKVDLLCKVYRVSRRSKRPFTWCVFAIQIFIDMQRELGYETERGLRELQETGAWLLRSLEDCLEFGKTNKMNKWHDANSIALKDVIRYARTWTQEDFMAVRVLQPGEVRDNVLKWGPYFFFKNNPMLCGLLLQRLFVYFHNVGVTLTASNGAVLGTIHLYNAALKNGALSPETRWADLEYLIATYGEAFVFVGERPDTARDCYVHFLLAMGAPPSIFTNPKRRRHYKDGMSSGEETFPAHPRKLSQLSLYLQQSFDGCGGIYRWSRAHDDSSAMLAKVVQAFLEKKTGPKPRPKHQDAPTLTPLEVLNTFKEAMRAEEQTLRFDMSRLSARCIELLRRVQKEGFPPTGPVKNWDSKLGQMITRIHYSLVKPKTQDVVQFMKIGPLIADVIRLEGNATYMDAISQMRIVRGPMTREWECAQLHTERVFGGVNSAEDVYHSWNEVATYGPIRVMSKPDVTRRKVERVKH